MKTCFQTSVYVGFSKLHVLPVTSCECERSTSALRRLIKQLHASDDGLVLACSSSCTLYMTLILT